MRSGHGKLLRVELRYEDGTILTLDGEGAERWKEQVDSGATMAYLHGTAFGPLPWVETAGPMPGPAKGGRR